MFRIRHFGDRGVNRCATYIVLFQLLRFKMWNGISAIGRILHEWTLLIDQTLGVCESYREGKGTMLMERVFLQHGGMVDTMYSRMWPPHSSLLYTFLFVLVTFFCTLFLLPLLFRSIPCICHFHCLFGIYPPSLPTIYPSPAIHPLYPSPAIHPYTPFTCYIPLTCYTPFILFTCYTILTCYTPFTCYTPLTCYLYTLHPLCTLHLLYALYLLYTLHLLLYTLHLLYTLYLLLCILHLLYTLYIYPLPVIHPLSAINTPYLLYTLRLLYSLYLLYTLYIYPLPAIHRLYPSPAIHPVPRTCYTPFTYYYTSFTCYTPRTCYTPLTCYSYPDNICFIFFIHPPPCNTFICPAFFSLGCYWTAAAEARAAAAEARAAGTQGESPSTRPSIGLKPKQGKYSKSRKLQAGAFQGSGNRMTWLGCKNSNPFPSVMISVLYIAWRSLT